MDKDYAKYLLEKTREDYNQISEDFSRTRGKIWEELKFLEEYISDGEKILDLGCGNGRLFELFKNKNIEYFGIDNSEKLIETAKNAYPDANFQVANALNLPFPKIFFDKIYSIAVLHQIPSEDFRLQFLKEAGRVLKEGGLLMLTVWYLWREKKARKLIFKNTLLRIIGKSKLDFKDIFVPWKNSESKTLTQRYYHCFTKRELEKIVKKADFKIKESGLLKHPEGHYNKPEGLIYRTKVRYNLYVIAQK